MSLFLHSKPGFSGSGSLVIKANWSDEISREGLQATWHVCHGFTTHFAVRPYHFLRFYGLRSFSKCFGVEVHWDRFNLCSLLGQQESGTGCTSLTSAAVQGDTCTAYQSAILLEAG